MAPAPTGRSRRELRQQLAKLESRFGDLEKQQESLEDELVVAEAIGDATMIETIRAELAELAEELDGLEVEWDVLREALGEELD